MAGVRTRYNRFFMGCILEDGEGKTQPSTRGRGFSKEDGMVRHTHRPKVGQNIGAPRRMEKGQSHGVPPDPGFNNHFEAGDPASMV